MNKQEFIENLSNTGEVSYEIQKETIQYFLDNYPVLLNEIITISTPLGQIQQETNRKEWTALNIVLNGGPKQGMNTAFNKLKNRVKEFEEFNLT